jgi:hypothetical protein
MGSHRIWRHVETNERFIVAFRDGDLLAAAGPVEAGDPYAVLSADREPSPSALSLVSGAVRNFIEEFELDEEGKLWNYAADTVAAGAY